MIDSVLQYGRTCTPIFVNLHLNRFQIGECKRTRSRPYSDTSRFNYIVWVQDLIDSTGNDYKEAYDPETDIIGLDMYGLRITARVRLTYVLKWHGCELYLRTAGMSV